ncbi:hypothetical protein GCK72_012440 [Caenorhabditis remanei]|uniref:DUF38 domain-containing protein n=1 Tax=Caenorhabditis remanei TaxID=31234 RepID=A0A6A5GKX4_CAERE|nr:hypothetical protein GCK72_012440 [Caenorhabditis remanei]KAF1755987.1 hypothetical protein GCK72_012440 [Caenorhabditis remanei]
MKATGLYLLVAVIPVLVNSCLVVKSPPCTCLIAALDWSNIDQYAGQSWYDYVVQRALTTPTKKPFENNCGIYIHCPRPYTLYDAEFVDVNDKRTPTQAVGHCDQKTNMWNVTDGLISHETTKWSPICVDESTEEFCTPRTNTTFLFAYSNDIDASKLQEIAKFLPLRDIRATQFTTLARVRFDVIQEEAIEYYKDYEEWKIAITSKLPDPSLSFTSTETGSDVLKVISKFINNSEVPICGSRIFILMKRSPNEEDITELVAQMRKYRVYVYNAVSSKSSGGSHPETVRRLTTQTNGLDFYYEDSSFTPIMPFYSPFFFETTLVYAANVILTPNGSITLPKIAVPRNDEIVYFNYDNFASGNLYLNASVYDVHLDYEISDNRIYAIEIRINTLGSDGYWIPYDD